MRDDDYEWDDAKAAGNRRKHHVSFETARMVFDDAMALDQPDLSEDYDEDRYIILGMVGEELLSVAYTERDGRYRISSARPATRQEHHDYDQGS